MSELDFPPTKRRRTTLTDTLLTSALNIALISGAVGMTAYRLYALILYIWRRIISYVVFGRRWRGEDNAIEGGEEPCGYEEDAWVRACS